MIEYRTIDSPIGLLTLAGRDSVLMHLRMVDQTYEPSRAGWSPNPRAFGEAVEQLAAYFAGERTDFDFEFDLHGSEFQRRVWKALLTIPYGETRSYGRIAEQIGAPGPRALWDWPTGITRSRSSCRATGSSARTAPSPATAVACSANALLDLEKVHSCATLFD